MSIHSSPRGQTSRNYLKHTNPNPIQRFLLGRFHERVSVLVAGALPTGGKVCDVGCGEGFVASYLLARQPSLDIFGLDRAFGAVAHGASLTNAASFVQADVGQLPVAEKTVDLALCLEVLEHLDEPRRTLAELGRISRKWVLVSTPNQPWFSLANLSRLKNIPTLGDDPEHVQWWTGPGFIRMVSGSFRVEQVVYSLPWTIVLARAGTR